MQTAQSVIFSECVIILPKSETASFVRGDEFPFSGHLPFAQCFSAPLAVLAINLFLAEPDAAEGTGQREITLSQSCHELVCFPHGISSKRARLHTPHHHFHQYPKSLRVHRTMNRFGNYFANHISDC
jgi:hypothetical protein